MLAPNSPRLRGAAATAAGALLLAYPAMLYGRGGMNAAFLLLLLLSAGLLLAPGPRWSDRELAPGPAWAFAAALLGLPAAILMAQLASGRGAWPDYDAPARFALALPVFLGLRRLPPRCLRTLPWGFALGAGASAAQVLLAPRDWGDDRLGNAFLNPIHFGDIALCMGVLAGFSLGWIEHARAAEGAGWRLLKLLALGAGLYASLRSGSRGGWIALPAFAAIAWLAAPRGAARRHLAWGCAAATVLALMATAALPGVHARIAMIGADLHDYAHGQLDTSLGIRLQLWEVALRLFLAHPLFGVGPGGFKALMPAAQQAGWLTPTAAGFGRGEVHSEVLARLAQLGACGMLALLALYVVPFVLFLWRRNAAAPQVRAAARMGMALSCGFFIFGLSVETFDLTLTAAFYALSIAALMACAYPADCEPASTEPPCSAS
jgi:O-antigen ligase